MIDSLFWIYYSATAPLTRLDAVMDAFSMFKEKQQTPKFKEKLQKIKERMAEYNPREILPKFLFRLLIIVAVFTLVYSIIYFSLTILDPGSFVDSNNSRVLTWEHILFYSVTNTTGVGSEISAQTFWARVFVQFHGITTLFIFVFMLTLVTSVALESIESQKNSLVQKISEIEENLSEDVEKDAK